jgi:sigma-54 dependent transcriptional regulator, acetoin dehydrogenase operon transcriptional activator AcoR
MVPTSSDSTLQAWESFQATGRCEATAIAPPILRSWRRCAAAGLDPSGAGHAAAEEPMPAHDAADDALIALARPYMEDLYQFVEGSGFAVLLADAELTAIEIIGDAEILEEIRSFGLGHGASWREEVVGTIALNLALHEALPWQTHGAEHFCARYHQLACSAAPLFDVAGQAMGVLGLTRTPWAW